MPILVSASILKENLDSYVEVKDVGFACKLCGYQANKRQRITYHVEAKHMESPGYECDVCQKFCPTKNALCIHKSRFHRN